MRSIGQGTGDQDAGAGLERKDAVVLEQDDGFLNGLLGRCQMLGSILHRLGGFHVHIGVLEQTQQHFHAQDVAHGVVNGLHAHGSAPDQFFQVREEAEGHHIHIHAGVHGLFGHVLAVHAKSMIDHLSHGVPVGDYQAVEAPFAAEDVLHHEGIARGRHAVVVVEGSHQCHGARLDGSLERRQIHIAQLALGEVGAVVVTAAFGSSIAHEMLDTGGHRGAVQAGTLVTAHHGFTHPGVQVSVLTAALGNAAPTGIAGNVQHGRERPADTLGGGLDGCHTGSLFHQGGVKGGRQAQRNGINGVETVNDVAAHQQRNVQAGFLYGNALEFIQLHRVYLI